jgi:hypothetical protein
MVWLDMDLRYVSDGEVKLQGYTNFDWVRSAVDQENHIKMLLQTSVALNATKAEYIAVSVANREAVWLWKLLAGLFDLELEPTLIYCDNQSCVKLSENHVFHDKSKHIEIKYHYIRDMV